MAYIFWATPYIVITVSIIASFAIYADQICKACLESAKLKAKDSDTYSAVLC